MRGEGRGGGDEGDGKKERKLKEREGTPQTLKLMRQLTP